MKNKYSLKLIWDYVNGEEVQDIDELEADYKFIMEVIKVTKDKKMYNLCSEEIKKNYEFIRFIIEEFKNDQKFITEVAINYIKEFGEEDITSKELIFLMCELIKNFDADNDEFIYFNVKKGAIYNTERVIVEKALSEEDGHWQKEFGLGFIYILSSDLGNSEIITRYFATSYLNEIFYECDNLTLDELVHRHFSSYDILKEIGIKEYILNYVGYKDKYLKDYLINNLDLTKKLEQSITYIGLNWNNYLERLKYIKEEQFETEGIKLIEKYKASFSYEEACHHIDKMNLGLPVKLKEYFYYDKNCDDYIDYSNDIMDVINENNISFNDYKCLKEIINLAKKIYVLSDKERILDERIFTYSPIIEKEKAKARILKFYKRKK